MFSSSNADMSWVISSPNGALYLAWLQNDLKPAKSPAFGTARGGT